MNGIQAQRLAHALVIPHASLAGVNCSRSPPMTTCSIVWMLLPVFALCFSH